MADCNQWAFDIETDVFSKMYALLSTKYPKALITKEEQSSTSPTFPSILIQSVAPAEKNADLETQINSVLYSTQNTIKSNKSRSEAMNIASEVAKQYKNLSFQLVDMPYCRKDDNLWVATFRARRTIDRNDRL